MAKTYQYNEKVVKMLWSMIVEDTKVKPLFQMITLIFNKNYIMHIYIYISLLSTLMLVHITQKEDADKKGFSHYQANYIQQSEILLKKRDLIR